MHYELDLTTSRLRRTPPIFLRKTRGELQILNSQFSMR